ncbi:MAG: hypothetical protein NZ888_00055 [Candidatus Nitrosocaldus sp.]|nr:hypothetical protein [Candidatus Nitrosocaldus sp.]MDW7999624.1 hypothetical protein [Candidatus Nitrosocaldus sp.]
MAMVEDSSTTHAYGALPFYQVHFVVKGNGKMLEELLLARTRKRVRGMVRKSVEDVWWEGGKIAERLNSDTRLKQLLLTVLKDGDDIFVDPVENAVRIYSRFKMESEVVTSLSREVIEVYNIISGHVKSMMREFE